MTRRTLVAAGVSALAAVLAGCSQGIPKATLLDATVQTQQTLLDLLLGPAPGRRGSANVPADPPLLEKGVYENVVLSMDAEGFVEASRGNIKIQELRTLEKEVLNGVGKVLEKRGFTLRGAVYPPPAIADARTLLVTLTPFTEEGGAPSERAAGRGTVYVLVRLTVSDPQTGANLRVRDYYSGRDATTGKVTMKRLR